MKHYLINICERTNTKSYTSVIKGMASFGEVFCISKYLYVLSVADLDLNSKRIVENLSFQENSDILVLEISEGLDMNWFFKYKFRSECIDKVLNNALTK